MKPTEELRAEHGGILRMLEVLQAILGKMGSQRKIPKEHIEKIMEFLKVFVDTCHHSKEEELLFPALEESGFPIDQGPMGVMLLEHQIGQELVERMDRSRAGLSKGNTGTESIFMDASKTYINLLRQHIGKENNILFPMVDRSLSQERQDQISEQFEHLERKRIGEGRHKALHKLLADLTHIYVR